MLSKLCSKLFQAHILCSGKLSVKNEDRMHFQICKELESLSVTYSFLGSYLVWSSQTGHKPGRRKAWEGKINK